MTRTLLLSVSLGMAVVLPVIAQGAETFGLQCQMAKDGKVIANVALYVQAGKAGSVLLRDQTKWTFAPTRIDAHQLRLTVDVKSAEATAAVTLMLTDHDASSAKISLGNTVFDVQISLLKANTGPSEVITPLIGPIPVVALAEVADEIPYVHLRRRPVDEQRASDCDWFVGAAAHSG